MNMERSQARELGLRCLLSLSVTDEQVMVAAWSIRLVQTKQELCRYVVQTKHKLCRYAGKADTEKCLPLHNTNYKYTFLKSFKIISNTIMTLQGF
jgi:hypothetical protein